MSEIHASDLQISLSTIKHKKDLIGYRNLLSYSSSLGIHILPKSSLNPGLWTYIGSGSYSTTWRAELGGGSGYAVAVKQPKASFTRAKADVEDQLQHEALSSMIQEQRILAHPKLRSHPNLPHILGVFFQEEENPPGIRPCLIFELAVSDLREYLHDMYLQEINGPEMMGLCSNVASGICALHAYGLVHRDIKPDNILLFRRDNELTATIGDLGTCGVPSQTCGVIPGTLEFCGPEYYQNSPFHRFVNQPPRDIYSFGLVVFSVLTYCKERPFELNSQFEIQHDDKQSLEALLSRIPTALSIPQLREVISACIIADPQLRKSIFDICQLLNTALGHDRQFDEIQELAEAALLTDPDTPRVNILGQMPLPAHLLSKLLSEYILASDGTHSIRLALTMAALYSGAVGPGIERPWDTVAKAQWLLKAVELGSYAAINPIMSDSNVLRVVEEFGDRVLEIRQPTFSSPSIDLPGLLSRLRGFAAMPDVDSLNVLVFLGGEVPDATAQQVAKLTANKDERQQRVRMAIPSMWQLEKFTLNRDSDLEVVDSDAYDLYFNDTSDIVRSVYNNNHEGFIALAEEFGLEPKDDDLQYFMALAIFNCSLDIVRYLLDQYNVGPDDSWEGMTHLNHSVIYRRLPIAKLLLERGASVSPATGDKLSALHLVSRHDNEQLVRLICEHLKARGNLVTVLESKTTEGPLTDNSAVYVAMICRAWKSVQVMLEYGADPNAGENGSRLIDFAVLPMSPAVPTSILQMLLQGGAVVDRVSTDGRPPLLWAIQSSNVLAVLHLLLHGASTSSRDSPDFIEEAESSEEEMISGERVDVLDEDGRLCPNGWEDVSEATSLILGMLRVASMQVGDWKKHLQEMVNASSEGCKGKMWIVDKIPPTFMMEIHIPCS